MEAIRSTTSATVARTQDSAMATGMVALRSPYLCLTK